MQQILDIRSFVLPSKLKTSAFPRAITERTGRECIMLNVTKEILYCLNLKLLLVLRFKYDEVTIKSSNYKKLTELYPEI